MQKSNHLIPIFNFQFKFILNHTTKEYVEIPVLNNPDDWAIHPLPLLTCEGNGRGGGDFGGDDYDGLIGLWSRHSLESVIDKSLIPENYEELNFNLKK